MAKVNTKGGASVRGNVRAGGDFIGRDRIENPINIDQLNVYVQQHITNNGKVKRYRKALSNKDDIVNNLYQSVIVPLKTLFGLIIVLLLVIVFSAILLFSPESSAKAPALLILLTLMFLLPIVYNLLLRWFHFRLEQIGFYCDLSANLRTSIKREFQSVSWGDSVLDWYMHLAIALVIETDKRKANKRLKSFL